MGLTAIALIYAPGETLRRTDESGHDPEAFCGWAGNPAAGCGRLYRISIYRQPDWRDDSCLSLRRPWLADPAREDVATISGQFGVIARGSAICYRRSYDDVVVVAPTTCRRGCHFPGGFAVLPRCSLHTIEPLIGNEDSIRPYVQLALLGGLSGPAWWIYFTLRSWECSPPSNCIAPWAVVLSMRPIHSQFQYRVFHLLRMPSPSPEEMRSLIAPQSLHVIIIGNRRRRRHTRLIRLALRQRSFYLSRRLCGR